MDSQQVNFFAEAATFGLFFWAKWFEVTLPSTQQRKQVFASVYKILREGVKLSEDKALKRLFKLSAEIIYSNILADMKGRLEFEINLGAKDLKNAIINLKEKVKLKRDLRWHRLLWKVIDYSRNIAWLINPDDMDYY